MKAAPLGHTVVTGIAVAVLAGGRSARMGRDKAALRLRGRTLLAHARAVAESLGWPVRVIRRDRQPGCGPLGGVHTALPACRAAVVVFLAVDMPFVSPAWLRAVVRGLGARRAAAFAAVDGVAGFPFAVRATALPLVERQIEQGEFSLQALARTLEARLVTLRSRERELTNLNTPGELVDARRRSGKPKRRGPRRETARP